MNFSLIFSIFFNALLALAYKPFPGTGIGSPVHLQNQVQHKLHVQMPQMGQPKPICPNGPCEVILLVFFGLIKPETNPDLSFCRYANAAKVE